jgi:hypothetical protein
MNEEIEQELISKFTDRLTDISNFEYDLLEAQAVGFIALVRADCAREILGIIPPNGEAWFIPEMKRKFFAITDKWEGK